MPADIREFHDAVALARALAMHVAQTLSAAVVARGEASLAVSGGRTPVRFFEALSERPVDWSRVTITLVDERWVPPVSDRSNAGLVARHLIRGPASEARFVPLTDGLSTPEARRDTVERTLASVPWPLDVVVLGMGDDGHTASFFPAGDSLARCLDPSNPHRVEAIRAPGAGEPRITLTLSAVLAAGTRIIHFEGGAKRAVLDRALLPGPAEELPIRAVLESSREPVPVFTCP
ncbi:MAG: 6-phosphogluconolactonase [Burkholderiales bacterium]